METATHQSALEIELEQLNFIDIRQVSHYDLLSGRETIHRKGILFSFFLDGDLSPDERQTQEQAFEGFVLSRIIHPVLLECVSQRIHMDYSKPYMLKESEVATEEIPQLVYGLRVTLPMDREHDLCQVFRKVIAESKPEEIGAKRMFQPTKMGAELQMGALGNVIPDRSEPVKA